MKKNYDFIAIAGVIIFSLLIAVFVYCAAHLDLNEWVFTDHRIEVINGCQYIKTPAGNGYNLTHAGNCTNEVHQPK